MDRKMWSGPLGIARIICVLSATVATVLSFAELVGLITLSPAKIYPLMTITLVAMAFVVGHHVGQSKRP